jgi:hypothetical protein
MEDEKITAIREAAEHLKSVRTRRIKLSQQEGEAATQLIALMHEHRKKVVQLDGGVRVELLTGKEKVKVKIQKEDDEDGEDRDDDEDDDDDDDDDDEDSEGDESGASAAKSSHPFSTNGDESWRSVTLQSLAWPEKTIMLLHAADIHTVGNLADYSAGVRMGKFLATDSRGRRLTDIDGVGAATAEKIEAAMVDFWKTWKPKTEAPSDENTTPEIGAVTS